jgi:hypothetical protein
VVKKCSDAFGSGLVRGAVFSHSDASEDSEVVCSTINCFILEKTSLGLLVKNQSKEDGPRDRGLTNRGLAGFSSRVSEGDTSMQVFENLCLWKGQLK